MALPPALLQFVEQHGCFSGCYGSSSNVHAFTASTVAAQGMISITCLDCLLHVGVLASLLPNGLHSYQLADEVSRHLRARRGYSLSVSGYHTQGPGFWLSAVYWSSCNVFLIDGDRSRNRGTDLDLLMLSFQHGVLKPPVPAMLDPRSFVVTPIFLDVRQPIGPVVTKADLFTSAGVSALPKAGWKKVTMAEFVGAAPQPAAVAPVAGFATIDLIGLRPAGPTIGDRCPKCGAEVRQRSLLHQTFVGCMC
jgi:hypothetical protein